MATFTLSLTVPDNRALEILEAFARQKGQDPTGMSNAALQAFMKSQVIEFIREAYLADKRITAEEAARVAAQQEVNNVSIT